MEEADYLCTRIGKAPSVFFVPTTDAPGHTLTRSAVSRFRTGIVSRGRMRCLGTQERLKARFGNGYMLAVVATEGRIAEAEAYVAQILPNAQFLESFADTVRYRIAKVRLALIMSAHTKNTHAAASALASCSKRTPQLIPIPALYPALHPALYPALLARSPCPALYPALLMRSPLHPALHPAPAPPCSLPPAFAPEPDRHCRQQGHARVHRAKARVCGRLGPVDDDHRRRLFAHCAP